MKPEGYWEVVLTPPTGARDGLIAVTKASDQAIQNCADLLATGNGGKAENMLVLFHEEGLVKSEDYSLMVEQYESKTATIEDVRKDMETQHGEVQLTANTTYETSSAAFGAIQQDVRSLKEELGKTYPLDEDGLISVATDNDLCGLVLDTVDSVWDEVWKAVNHVDEQAREIDNRAPTPTSSGGFAPPSFPGSGGNDAEYVAPAREEDYAEYTGSADVDSAIEDALQAMGLIATDEERATQSEAEQKKDQEVLENWTRGYRVLIERESGGDPNAVNNWDSNAAAGNSSRGLTQTIPTTFEANHVAGTSNNIHDPVANVAASMNYVMNRYDVAADGSNLQTAVQQTDPSRPAKGY